MTPETPTDSYPVMIDVDSAYKLKYIFKGSSPGFWLPKKPISTLAILTIPKYDILITPSIYFDNNP